MLMRHSILHTIADLQRELEVREIEPNLTNSDTAALGAARFYLFVASWHATISRCARRGNTFDRMLICGNHWATADDYVDQAEELLRPFRLR